MSNSHGYEKPIPQQIYVKEGDQQVYYQRKPQPNNDDLQGHFQFDHRMANGETFEEEKCRENYMQLFQHPDQIYN